MSEHVCCKLNEGNKLVQSFSVGNLRWSHRRPRRTGTELLKCTLYELYTEDLNCIACYDASPSDS